MEWIKVFNKMPERNKTVLVYCDHYHIKEYNFLVGSYNGVVWVNYENDPFIDSKEITHWMPLPEPPKQS